MYMYVNVIVPMYLVIFLSRITLDVFRRQISNDTQYCTILEYLGPEKGIVATK